MDTTVPGLDPRVTLRAATLALGVTGGLWRLVNVVGIPIAADAPAFALGVLLGAAQLAWTARLVVRPSRAWLLGGAAGAALALVASLVVLASVPVGRAGLAPAVVGIVLQLSFLLATLAGAATSWPAAIVRQATRLALVTVALGMSVLVAGGAHDHAQAAGGPRRTFGTPAPAGALPTRSLLCHLI